jgi:ABC-type sugar transport system substrate-binding protein
MIPLTQAPMAGPKGKQTLGLIATQVTRAVTGIAIRPVSNTSRKGIVRKVTRAGSATMGLIYLMSLKKKATW